MVYVKAENDERGLDDHTYHFLESRPGLWKGCEPTRIPCPEGVIEISDDESDINVQCQVREGESQSDVRDGRDEADGA